MQKLVENTCFFSSGTYMNNYKTWVNLLQWNFQLWIDLYGNQISQKKNLQKDEVVSILFQSSNFILIFYDSFWCPKPNVLTLNLDFIYTCFLVKIDIQMKCFYVLIILLLSFHVIGGGKFLNMSLKKCVNLPTFSQIGSKGFCNLLLVDLTKVSPFIVGKCIQGRNLNNVKWLCF